MDASYKIQRGIYVHLIQFFMCPEFWVHIRCLTPLFFCPFRFSAVQWESEGKFFRLDDLMVA